MIPLSHGYLRRALALGLLCAGAAAGGTASLEGSPPVRRPDSAFAERDGATGETYAVQTVPDELLPRILARFPFDTDENSDPAAGLAVPVLFTRERPGYTDGRPVPVNRPRLVKGRFGNGLLLEEAHANLLSRNQAAVEGTTTSSFVCLKGAAIAFSTQTCWQGRQSLEVQTPGLTSDEGVGIALTTERARYNGQQVVPAYTLASVYLKGSNALVLSLKEAGGGTESEPVIVQPNAKTWRRFFCAYAPQYPAADIGPGRASDWRGRLPDAPPLAIKLVFACVTLDRRQTVFHADGFQVEQRWLPFAAQGPGASPRSWAPGGAPAAQDAFSFATRGDAAAAWTQAGAISFWFKPGWELRDGTWDLLLRLAPAGLRLQHLRTMLELSPAGAECAPCPYDWQGTWHHLAVTWNPDGRRTLFVDGYDYPAARGELHPIPGDTDRLQLGAPEEGLAPNGVVDELILFRGELGLEEAKAIAAYTPAIPEPRQGERPTSNTQHPTSHEPNQ